MNNLTFNPIDPKPDFPKLEEEVLKFWEDNKVFEKSLEKNKEDQPFTFYDGPPFATGLPHYGHILASTIKDLVPRYQTMKGRFVRRRWGWDCHGLPIEEIVERQLGISGKKDIEKIGIEKFNQTCRTVVLQYVAEWRKMVRRMARWTEFDNSYKTMDRDFMESVWWAFKQIHNKGLVYEGRRVLLYCPRCETPISNFEVAMDNSYKDVTEEAVTIKFKIQDSRFPDSYLLAWTTTPWTLPGNVALAVGTDIDYVKVKSGDGVYILAKERLSQIPDSQIQDSFKGSELVGLEYEPLFDVPEVKSDKSYKVYPADFVTIEEGTGIVHTAVVYGEDDYNLGMKVGLPVVPLLDEKGIFNEKSPSLVRGKYFKDSEKLIKKDLETRGLMFEKKQHQHSYPHCWRCGTTLFYNAIPAWFINIQKIKNGLVESNEKEINWYPEHLKHGRYQKSVEAAPDWNISRNRYWGNPIPVWKCDDKTCDGQVIVGSIQELGLSKNVFIFSRHGEAEQNVEGIVSCYPEKTPYHLTDKGVVRAHSMADRIQQQGGVDMIFSSDLLRTHETANAVGDLLGVPVATDPRLREYNIGIYNGKTKEEFDTKFPFESRWETAPDEGETNHDVQRRMLDFIHDINQRYNGKKILVVSHGDPIYVVMKYFGSVHEYPKYATPVEIDVSINDLHRPYIDQIKLACPKCGKSASRITEIFDSWVEAGSMPFAEYHYPFDQKETFESRFPAQFVAEYIAQTRAWFYVMHVISYNLFGRAPFENVVTTGTILAEDGSKMSKSKNNYPDPWKVIDQYGVDALRFYLMNSPVMNADNLNFKERELGIAYRKNVLILWNVFNYFVTYANEARWKPEENSKGESQKSKVVLDKWIVAKTQALVNEVTQNLDAYNTVRATRAIEDYINELSTWYVRRSRGRKDDDFFATLHHCLLVLSKVIAPVMPYMSELIYQNLNRSDILSVHLSSWPKAKDLTEEAETIINQMQQVRSLVELGLRSRNEVKIKVRQALAGLKYSVVGKLKLSEDLEKILLDELNVKQADFDSSEDKFSIDLDTNLTPELRKEGLARELERLVQDMRKKSGLKVGEMTKLSYDTKDDELMAAFALLDTKKTYVSEITQESGGDEHDVEGKKVSLRLS